MGNPRLDTESHTPSLLGLGRSKRVRVPLVKTIPRKVVLSSLGVVGDRGHHRGPEEGETVSLICLGRGDLPHGRGKKGRKLRLGNTVRQDWGKGGADRESVDTRRHSDSNHGPRRVWDRGWTNRYPYRRTKKSTDHEKPHGDGSRRTEGLSRLWEKTPQFGPTCKLSEIPDDFVGRRSLSGMTQS